MIKAFTVLEVMITMLIAAILIGMTYSAYDMISKSYKLFIRKNDEMAEIIHLDKIIRKDFASANIIYPEPNGMLLFSRKDTVTYSFESDRVIRRALLTDTIKLGTEKFQVSFEERPLIPEDAGRAKNRIDDMTFTLNYRDEQLYYHYHKSYSAADLFNKEPNALN